MIQIKWGGVESTAPMTTTAGTAGEGGAGEGAGMSRGDYLALFSGRLYGILQWDRFARIWDHLRNDPEGWYVRDFGRSALPDAPMPGAEFLAWLEETEDFLRRRHREEYCGFLYVDDQEAPSFLKIYDPRKMGTSCGCSGAIRPRWTVSRMRPVAGEEETAAEMDTSRRRSGAASLLERLFGR